jgi:hypothetical protein
LVRLIARPLIGPGLLAPGGLLGGRAVRLAINEKRNAAHFQLISSICIIYIYIYIYVDGYVFFIKEGLVRGAHTVSGAMAILGIESTGLLMSSASLTVPKI